MARKRQGFFSSVFISPIKSEVKRRVKRRTKMFFDEAFAPRGKQKISATQALEFDRKRLRIRR